MRIEVTFKRVRYARFGRSHTETTTTTEEWISSTSGIERRPQETDDRQYEARRGAYEAQMAALAKMVGRWESEDGDGKEKRTALVCVSGYEIELIIGEGRFKRWCDVIAFVEFLAETPLVAELIERAQQMKSEIDDNLLAMLESGDSKQLSYARLMPKGGVSK